jgi:hypothetical protein
MADQASGASLPPTPAWGEPGCEAALSHSTGWRHGHA